MSTVLRSDELGLFLKSSGITKEEFAEAVNCSVGTVKRDTSSERALNWEKQKLYSDKAIELAEHSEKNIDPLRLFDFRLNKDFAKVTYDDVVAWINTEDVSTLSTYWNSFDDTFQWIDKDATIFLLLCSRLKTLEADLRVELLRIMQGIPSSIGAVQSVLPTVQIFLNRERSIKQAELNFNKSNDGMGKASDYRESLIERFSEIFYEDNTTEKGELIYCHLRCVTAMDALDWDLLIAYTLVCADDESGEKMAQIEDKLHSLIEQVNKA